MTTQEWKDLPDLQSVARAQADGWEIEKRVTEFNQWIPWEGSLWSGSALYRGRPKQPKKITVTSECWRYKDTGDLIWRSPGETHLGGWQRFIAGDITGEVEE